MTPIFFISPAAFRAWLEENHNHEKEVLVGFYKVASGKQNMTWSQSVDEAICFGWIDGIRKSVDDISYCIRFTPRNPSSIWSAVNIKKVEELTRQGLMQPAGIKAFSNRNEEKSKIYSFESGNKAFTDRYVSLFKSNKKAWEFFTKQAPSYQKTTIHWIMSAKQEATQLSRLEKTIAESLKQNRLWDKYNLKRNQ
jgi:uncharacterized protein YdeI (YjbR/CyaY-like superfamily)